MTITCPKCGSMNITTAGTCANCGWSQFAQVTLSAGVAHEIEIRVSGKALLDDYKRLLFENKCLESRIAELEAALTNARELVGMTPPPAFPEWIPVKEKLPNLFETVLIWAYCDCDGYDRFDLAFNSGLVWVGTQQDIEYEDVTHWMPLPQPPEVQE